MAFMTPMASQAALNAGIGLLSGNTWNEQAANALAGVQQATQQNKTAQWLEQNGYPDMATMLKNGQISGTDAFNKVMALQAAAAAAKKPKYEVINGRLVQTNPEAGKVDVVADFSDPKKPNIVNAGDGRLYNSDTGEWISAPSDLPGKQTEYGLTPVWMQDKDGNMRLGVPGKDGTFKLLNTPDGLKPLPGVNNIDTGTAIQTQDKRTGQIISSTPKDVTGEQAAKDMGKALTEAKVQLAGAKQTAQMVADGVADLMKDPALGNALGPINSRLPTFREDTARVESKIKMLQGQAFMQARQLLKGGGQITDFEGRKAEEAYARLSTAQNKDDFTTALTDFNSAVQAGVKKLEAQAKGDFSGDTTTAPVTAVNPQTGERVMLQNGQWVPVK